MGATPNPADVEDGLDQVGNLESAVEPMPTFTSVNPAPCRVGPPHSGFYRSRPSQGNQKCRREPPCTICYRRAVARSQPSPRHRRLAMAQCPSWAPERSEASPLKAANRRGCARKGSIRKARRSGRTDAKSRSQALACGEG